MRTFVFRPRSQFNQLELDALQQAGATIVDTEVELKDVQELFADDEPKIIAAKPGGLVGGWDGLPIAELAKVPNLKSVVLATTSFSWVNGTELRKLNIDLCNTPGKSTNAVSEFNLMAMYMLLRNLPTIVKLGWKLPEEKTLLGREARGLRAGIIGLGQIGSRTAELCAGVGMEVSYWNRSQKQTNYQHQELDTLISESDVLFLTIAADSALDNLISKARIDLMRSSTLFISVTHENVYDSKYLLEKVARQEVGGFAFEGETLISDYQGNVLAMPELAYYTAETFRNESRIFTETILAATRGTPINIVN